MSYTIVTGPTHGTLSGTAPNLTYTPGISYSGADSLTFKVRDGSVDNGAVTVSITIQAPVSVPAAPGGLTATAVSKAQINLAWADNSSNEDGFKIERSTDNKNWTQIATVGMNARSYSSDGLSANKTYYYRVRAYNLLGNSSYSNTASAKTLRYSSVLQPLVYFRDTTRVEIGAAGVMRRYYRLPTERRRVNRFPMRDVSATVSGVWDLSSPRTTDN